MRIVLATPLYPPEVAEPGPYVKELARRLARSHTVTLVAYARMPEQVPGVRIVTVHKQRPLPLRLVSYFFALLRETRQAEVLYAVNGASVELAAAFVAFITRRPLIFYLGDVPAHERALESTALGAIERFAFRHAATIIQGESLSRPEIMPLEPRPTKALAAYEEAWDKHLKMLEEVFAYAS